MIEFNILGNSHATVSMILESLHRIHQGQVRVKIIENTPVDDDLPFAIDRLETIKVYHEEWDHESPICV